jgi:hypothetical protein
MFILCLILIQNFIFAQTSVDNHILNQIIQENGGTLPEPFPVLKEKIQQKLFEEYGQVIAVHESEFDGRSIDAKHDSHKFRRHVVSYTIPIGRAFNHPSPPDSSVKNVPLVMIGYAPTANQLEAIIRNRDTGSYEFLVKHQYSPGSQFNQREEDRYFRTEQICTSCHQSGAGIFSRFPWTEAPFEVSTRERFQVGNAEAFRENPNLLFFTKGDERRGGFTLALQNTTDPRLFEAGTNLFSMDLAIRDSNTTKQLSTICTTACQGDKTCEKLMFTLAMAKFTSNISDTDKDLLATWRSELNQRLQWNKDNFAYPSSVIPDRNPYTNEQNGGTVAFHSDPRKIYDESTASTEIETDLQIIGLNNYQVGNQFVDNPGSPLTLRPLVNPLTKDDFITRLESFGAFACYGFTDKDIKNASIEMDDLVRISVTSETNHYLLHSYDGRSALLTAVKNQQEGAITCTTCKKPQVDPSVLNYNDLETLTNLFTLSTQEVKSQDPTAYFKEFCSSCHSSGALQLPLNDLEAMRQYESPRGSPKDRLSRDEMPFKGSKEAQKLTPELRQQMIQALE